MSDYTSALKRCDWNMAVRRAQESVELFIKGAIYLTGDKPAAVHHDGPARTLRDRLESASSVVVNIVDTRECPVQIQCCFADSAADGDGHALNIFKNEIALSKMEGGIFKEVWKGTLSDEFTGPLAVIHERKRGGCIFIVSGSNLVATFNELGGEFTNSDEFALPVQLSDRAWDAMISATQKLYSQRLSSFYHEATYTQQDALEAGERMKLIYSLVKKLLGGPRYDWEPPEP